MKNSKNESTNTNKESAVFKMKQEKIFRVAVVGCGAISENHILPLSERKDVEIVALVDVKTDRAEEKRAQYAPDAHVYADYATMLEKEKPDAVHICTPHYLHASMAIEAMERGIAVFLEKPLAIRDEEIDRLLETERRTNARVCVSFQNRFLPRTQELLRLVEAHGGAKGCFGQVVWDRDEQYYLESGWRGFYATEGGGVMINQAIHTLDLALLLLGEPTELEATTANRHLRGKIEVEDTCELFARFEGDRQLLFYATTAHKRSIPVSLETVCADGTVFILRDQDLYEQVGPDCRPLPLPPLPTWLVGKPDWGVGHPLIIKRFYDALQNGGEMPITLTSASRAVRTLLRAYRAAEK